ncbi:antibiotic biosynthesis monooxygenase [Glutamicibacter sp.]|uniref:putative quinol monooxygenase n=1 Tax=Glutamicibacter sp. TaxID=1931995 RepID=UPI0028BECF58|nr:antibiotic biosynthesis monooxygenase [Glutamicibacter sp.]
MPTIRLTGHLKCTTRQQAEIVAEHLPLHEQLSRDEPGCLEFFVRPTGDPLIWWVSELFVDQASFDAHQQRVRASRWGSATEGIERNYTIEAVD